MKGETSDFEAAKKRTIARYRNASNATTYYVANKLRFDPLTRELHSAWARGEIGGKLVDLGSGRGQFSLFLAELGGVCEIFGIDHDDAKVEAARKAAAELRASFESGDVAASDVPAGDTILILDVLHYIPEESQDRLLDAAAQSLRPGGYLFLRETNRAGGTRVALAKTFERIGRALGINRGRSLHFREPGVYAERLARAGLAVSSADDRGALNNILIIARRPTGA